MTIHPPLPTPALTAIAAVLALASTPAWAQETVPADTAPVAAAPSQDPAVAPITPQSSAPAPALPPIAAPSTPQMATETAPAPATATAPVLPPVAQTQTEASANVPARAEATRTAERATPTRRAAPVERPAVTPATSTASVENDSPTQAVRPENDRPPALTPSELLMMQQRREQPPASAPAAPASVATQTGTDDSVYWMMGGVGAALILGIGSLAFLRRRDRVVEERDEALVTTTPSWTVPSTVEDEPMPLAPAVAATPAGFSAARTKPARGTEPLADAPRTPAYAAYAAPRTPALTGDDRFARLEAMVAEAPSAENPFVTRTKRLRRAAYLLDHDGETQEAASAHPAQIEREEAAPAPVRSTEHQKQPVFSYGKKPVSFRPNGWKPATS